MDTYAKGRLLKRGRIWHLDYFTDNKRVRESARTTNKTVAERLLAHKLSQMDAGTYVHIEKTKKMGFADFVARYLEQYSNGRATWLKSKGVFPSRRLHFLAIVRSRPCDTSDDRRLQGLAHEAANQEWPHTKTPTALNGEPFPIDIKHALE